MDKNKGIGIISINSKGVGFITPHIDDGHRGLTPPSKFQKDRDKDIMVSPEKLNTAFPGDEVGFEITGKNRFDRVEGKVTSIIKRARTTFVGILEKAQNGFYLIADDKRVYVDILIPQNLISENLQPKAQADFKAQIEITDWKGTEGHPIAKILSVLGPKGNNDVEMHSIVLEKGFDIGFPDEVVAEAHTLEKTEKPIRADEIAGRRDMRGATTFTIDPIDAKDFDDAISYNELSENADEVEIGVHIADVSYYVRPGTALDKEAYKRAFSVYLVDRTIPMLPEVLSNDLCSLNPQTDKLAFSSIFKMKKSTGEVTSSWFGRTIINSNKRFSYEEAQEVIDRGSASPSDGAKFQPDLLALRDVARKLREKKFENGAIDFETEEVKFRLDENGKPIEVYKKQRLETHKLVEEYMLLSNRQVAEFIFKSIENKNGAASIYRIHDVPQTDKIHELALFLKAMGYDLPVKDGKGGNGSISAKDINALLKEIAGKPEESLIKTATIRSMSKAIYSPANIGHFGLAFEYYTHFTSPIRRYADLLVHRILQNILVGGKISQDEFARYKRMADQCSEREVKAAEAERTSIKLKQVEYMSERVGQIFEGTISGVTEWGMYVEEKNTKCEGMIKIRDMTDDFYQHDEKRYALVGQKNKKVYSLGDVVKFKVTGADVERKSLDYVLAI
ncbi:MAG: ribonuclease R [Candidatus Pacebacteria bacterium]|nr:ribonuclease R [Candidatus Paceibacterota bacterium]